MATHFDTKAIEFVYLLSILSRFRLHTGTRVTKTASVVTLNGNIRNHSSSF